jgi:hypothetical protein
LAQSSQAVSTSENEAGGAFDVPIEIREKYGQKLVIYGSTQTHSIAKKVDHFVSHALGHGTDVEYKADRYRLQ